MTIELITGTPGAGKTCYAVAKRIMAETGRQIVIDRPGGVEGQTDIVERRIIVAGIRGLVVPHERIPHTLTDDVVSPSDIAKWNQCDDSGEPLYKRLPGSPPWTNVEELHDGKRVPFECTLFNWWLWCQPGDLIVCDEVQFIVPRGSLGKTPPHYIKSLEIHRHYGVDFIFITQSPTLLDTTIRNLVGLHRHVRALMGSRVCMLYEWDHASNTERITTSSKRFYVRKSAYFKLYKSTVAHVKPPTSGRAPLIVVPILLALVVFGFSNLASKFRPDRSSPGAAVASALPAGVSSLGSPPGWHLDPQLGHVPDKVNGCYIARGVCTCLDGAWSSVRVARELCERSAGSFDGLVKWRPRDPPRESNYGAAAGSPSKPTVAASAPGSV